MEDTRNVVDEFKGQDHDVIVQSLDRRGVELEIAIENLERDFSMGTIVRSANAFGVRHVHVVGSRQWNKRGAMMTDKYLHLHYYSSIDDFKSYIDSANKKCIVVDNVAGAVSLSNTQLPENSVLVFGAEGPGVSGGMLQIADAVTAIEQLGSTRSLNVGVAAGIVMYQWLQQNR